MAKYSIHEMDSCTRQYTITKYDEVSWNRWKNNILKCKKNVKTNQKIVQTI